MSAMKMIVTGVFCLTAVALQAATLQVGTDKAYKTIQAAVDAANTAGGDVIEVDEGTYTATSGFLFTLDRPVVVKAVGAQDKTTLKAAGAAGAAKVADAGAVLFGFTFDPNSASVPTLELSDGVVSNCVFKGTKSTASQMALVKGGLLEDVHFTPMNAEKNGTNGGAALISGGTMRNCTFRGIYTMTYGCNGMALKVDGGIVEGCTVEECLGCGANQTDGNCGSVYLNGGEMRNCIVRNNGSRSGCAGVYFASGILHDSLIYGNVASNCFAQASGGAGVRMTAKTAQMYNCVVSRNCTLFDSARKGYSGIQMSNGTVSNCVVYGNCGGDIYKTGGTVKFTCSGNTVEGEGNTCADAQLRSPETGDFSLLATAPIRFADMSAPAIGFSADRLEAKAVDGFATIAFTALKANIDEGLTYTWDFGDGSDSATGENVSHDYAPGLYTVTLTAGIYSCTRTKIIKVIPPVCHVWTGGSATIPYDTKEKAAKDFATAYFFGSDEIDVHPGTYACMDASSYTAVGRAVCVKGIGDRSEVIFSGLNKGNNRAMVVGHPDAIVENVTLTKGAANHNIGGSGLYMGAGLVSNCVITSNSHFNYGAAYLSGGRLTDSLVSKNSNISAGPGGGIYVEGAALVDSCLIKENTGNRSGGTGVGIAHADAIVSNCVITLNNHSGTRADEPAGAGVYLSKGLLVNCVVTNNTTLREGGGIRMTGGTVRGTLIADNTATSGGVGLGGGVYQDGGTIESCTIVANDAKESGGGVYQKSGDILNSIVYFNTKDKGGADNVALSGGTATYTCAAPILSGEGNTAADPTFGEAYHLTALSKACVDKGLNQPWMDGAVDLDGTNRIVNTTVDMGCYEFVPSSDEPFTVQFSAETVSGSGSLTATFVAEVTKYDAADCTFTWTFSDGGEETVVGSGTVQHTFAPGTFSVSVVATKGTESCPASREDYITVSPDVCYVSKDGSDTKPYSTWATAARTLDAALKMGATTIYMSNGVYEVAETVALGRKVKVVGVNGPETVRIRRTSDSARKLDNMVVMSVTSDDAWLEGVTLSHGLWSIYDTDGGNTLRLSAGVVTNCVIENGEGWWYGAVAVKGGRLVDSVIRNNTGTSTSSRCGGLSVFDGEVTGCVISNNHGMAKYSKDNKCVSMGVYIGGGVISNSLIVGNYSEYSTGTAGGIYMDGGLITHSRILGNRAGKRVGGIEMEAGTLRNSLIAGNSSTSTDPEDGGCGVLLRGGRVESCTIAGNSSPVAGAGVKMTGGALVDTIVAENGDGADCDIAPGSDVTYGLFTTEIPGAGNVKGEPLFTDSANGDYSLTAFSAAVDAGLELGWMGASKDLAGADRETGAAVDIGAYEFVGGAGGLACHLSVVSAERNADYNTVVVFAADVRGGEGDIAYSWDFGDESEPSAEAAPTHVYQPGTYTVTLTVTRGGVAVSETREDIVRAIPHRVVVAEGDSLEAAIASGADEVVLKPGTHEVIDGISLMRPVDIYSESGNPADTVIYSSVRLIANGKLRLMKIANPDVTLRNLTLRGGCLTTGSDDQPGATLWMNGGVCENCVLESGYCVYSAAVYVSGGVLRHSIIRNCTSWSSSGKGAGLLVTGTAETSGLVDGCVISNNVVCYTTWNLTGAGAYVSGTGRLRNSLVADNFGSECAGIAIVSADAEVENCTVVSNRATTTTDVTKVGGVETTETPKVLRNMIVWGNTAENGTANFAELNDPSAFSYSCSPALTAGVNHNLAGDPLFRRPAKGDWRLRGGSPCVGTGLVEGWMSGATDLRGRARKIGGAVSMGAYVCMPNGLSVIVR